MTSEDGAAHPQPAEEFLPHEGTASCCAVLGGYSPRRIRSCFAMSEPDVASSDPSQLATSVRRDGDHLAINGRKWLTTGAAHPACKRVLVMARDETVAPGQAGRHGQHSIVLVPMDAPGSQVLQR